MVRQVGHNEKGIDYWLVLFLIFLAAMNFKAKFFYFAFASLIVFVGIRQKFEVHGTIIAYVGLAVLMAIYNLSNGFMAALRCFAYVAVYLVGYNVISVYSKYRMNLREALNAGEKCTWDFLFSVAGGSFVHLMLNFLRNRGQNIGRNTIDVWSGAIMAATGQAAIGCLAAGVSVALILAAHKRYLRWTGWVMLGGLMAYNFILAGRTMIFMTLILFVAGYAFLVWKEDNRRKIVRIALWAIVAALFAVAAYSTNLGGIREQLQDSNLFERFGNEEDSMDLLEDTRGEKRKGFITNAYKYPLGGLNLRRQYGYAHDLLLDAYDEYGLIALILLCVILIRSVIEVWKLINNRMLQVPFRLCIFSVYMAIFIQFCLEPIFAGMPWLFAIYSLLNGCIISLNRIEVYCGR